VATKIKEEKPDLILCREVHPLKLEVFPYNGLNLTED